MQLGQPLIHLASVDSTNATLLKMLEKNPGLSEGTTVIADQQSKGRGRQGRDWFTADHGLACSVLLKPTAPLSSIPALSLLAAVAVWQALAPIVPSVGIKWPNDILVHGAKMCGILTESRIIQGKLLGVVLGIGINIDTPAKGWPTAINRVVCSVNDYTTQRLSRKTCMAMVLERLNYWYDCWLRDGFEPVRLAWQEAHIAHGQCITVRMAAQECQGIACGLAHDGALLINTKDGMQRVICGEVFVMEPSL
ncbi:MAG: biotin--[acetyl-CoA-carboxylase] ligase [Mariprofundaceae bacterium]|nr:biotin--[acetyl-CoA-carboxylase] ligase [Mariprofundaceae bacterium]